MYVFIFAIILFLIITTIYLVSRLRRFSLIKKIKNKVLSWIIPTIPIIIIILLFNYVNALVILIHLVIFFMLSEIIMSIIERKTNKQYKVYYAGIIAIVLTTFYLGIGIYLNYHVFFTHYTITTTKDLGQEKLRVVALTDAHLGATFNGKGFKKKMDKIKDLNSDILVIVGDFVDDDTTYQELKEACKSFSEIHPKYGIYFVYGNHDKGYFNYRDFTDKELKEELQKNNVHILEDDIVKINSDIYLIGRNDKRYPDRLSIDALLKNIDHDKYLIDLNHQPNDYNNELNKVDLVISGHTHGGQLFPLGYLGILLGANDAFKGLHQKENTTFIVSSGISSWALDFKTGAKSEIVIIDIIHEKK